MPFHVKEKDLLNVGGRLVIKAPSDKRPNKFNAIRTEVDGIKFHSAAEADRYCQLKTLQKHGDIRSLKLQFPFSLDVEGVHIADYIADFTYVDCETNQTVVEDKKGMKTREYIMKKRLMLAIHKIKILET